MATVDMSIGGEITQPYTSNPITISNADGSSVLIFGGASFPFPPKIDPNPSFSRVVKVTRTRPGATHPGYRIFGTFGATENDREISLVLDVVVPVALAQLIGYHDARPGVFMLSLGDVDATGAPIHYFVMFKDKGLKVEGYRLNQRIFQKVTMDLYVVQKTTQSFVSS